MGIIELAVQAGYEAFHSWRRKGLTVICLLLASAVAMGTSVYVDSFSKSLFQDVNNAHPFIPDHVSHSYPGTLNLPLPRLTS